MTRFIGTSSKRAELLMALGWDDILPYTDDLKAARCQAQLHTDEDGGFPVVMTVQETAIGCAVPAECINLYELVACETPQERLGFEATAGIADIISGILSTTTKVLDATHQHLRNAIDVGAGNQNAELPKLHELHKKLKDAHRKFNKVKNRFKTNLKAKRNGKPGVKQRAQQRKTYRESPEGKKAAQDHKEQQENDFWNNSGPNASSPKKTTFGTPATKKPKSGIRKPVKPRKPFSPKKPTQPKQPTAPKRPVGGINGTPQMKVANKTITVKGKINGQPATTTVHKGSHYKLVKKNGGIQLMRPGGKGSFLVAPSDVGKL